VVRGERTRGNRPRLKAERFKLVMMVNFLTMRTARQWSRLLGESVQAPSLEVFKTHSKIPIADQAGEGATSKLGFSGSGSTLQQVSTPRKDAAPCREKHLYRYRIHSV